MSKMSELSQALDELVACGEGLIRTVNSIREMFTGELEPKHQPEPVSEPPREEASAAPPVEQPKRYTFAEVRKAFSAKSHAGYTEQVKTLITSYGADKLSTVKEGDYPRLMADLEAIV
ncbi:DNA ligase [bacterium D16-76]|nr:DNA ligase [bacterium D16-76]